MTPGPSAAAERASLAENRTAAAVLVVAVTLARTALARGSWLAGVAALAATVAGLSVGLSRRQLTRRAGQGAPAGAVGAAAAVALVSVAGLALTMGW